MHIVTKAFLEGRPDSDAPLSRLIAAYLPVLCTASGTWEGLRIYHRLGEFNSDRVTYCLKPFTDANKVHPSSPIFISLGLHAAQSPVRFSPSLGESTQAKKYLKSIKMLMTCGRSLAARKAPLLPESIYTGWVFSTTT